MNEVRPPGLAGPSRRALLRKALLAAGAPPWASGAFAAMAQALQGTRTLEDEGATVTVFPAPAGERERLVIDSATDTVLFAPAVRDFQRRHPHASVHYADRQSLDIHARALAHARLGPAESGRRPGNPDLLISSSLDLQTQLANDGHVLPHHSEQTRDLPEGAHWRHEVFSLGAEPVVMAYQPRLLPAARAPQTRSQLLALLRERGSPLHRRIGMYDAALSGLGYLLATQDARLDSTAGVLLAAMGAAGVVLGGPIVPLLEQLDQGRLALVYNVPASYAQARIAAGSGLRVIYPQDYTLLTTRAAVIPATGGQAALARQFLDGLLSPPGQALLSRETGLLPIREAVGAGRDGRALAAGTDSPASPSGVRTAAWRPLVPGLGLLVYLDPLKRQRFLQAWRAAVQPPGAP